MSTNRVSADLEDRALLVRRRWLLGTLAVLAGACAVVWWPGCREYPTVTSRESLTLMKLLYTAANTRDSSRLAKVEVGVEKAAREGRLSAAEEEAFRKIVTMARAGDWEGAERASFRFAQDQVGQGFPAEREHHHGPHSHGDNVPPRKH